MKIINGKKKLPSPSYTSSMSDQMDDGDDESTPDELNIDEKDEGEGDEPTSRLYSKKNSNPDLSSLRDLVIHAPNLEDSRPSLGRNIANSLVAGATAFATKNPVKGLEIGQQLNDEAGNRKAEQFKQDLGAKEALIKSGDTGANLAQKDVAEQGGEDIAEAKNVTAQNAIEQRGRDAANRLQLNYDQLTEKQKQDLEQIARWHAETAQGQANLGLRGREVGLKEKELEQGKGQLKEVVDDDPNSPTFGRSIYKSVNTKEPGHSLSKLTGNESTNMDTLNSVMNSTSKLAELLNDPEVVKDLGAAKGKGQNILEYIGTSTNPKTQEFRKQLQLVSDIHAKALAARGGAQLMQHLEKSLGRGDLDVPMIKANLSAMAKNAVDMGEGILPGYAKHFSNHPLLSGKTVVKRGTDEKGNRVVQYSDGTVGPEEGK